MHQIIPFVTEVNEILNYALTNYPENKDVVMQVLNGRPASELRKLVNIKELRASGAFFTGSQLRNIAISKEFCSTINNNSVLVDPACGGGDLLLSCAPYLPIDSDIEETALMWSSKIIGIDIHSEFVEMAKYRLLLKAITLGSNLERIKPINEFNLFNGFRIGSIFDNLDALQKATHILLNPPFCMMNSPELCQWATGKVNSAAIFLETCIKNTQKGTRIVAILPDVLRSGTRYEKWRQFIESNCEISKLILYGQFDAWADIDVFVMELIVRKEPSINSCQWVNLSKEKTITISDKFDISIGPVVDFRDPIIGPPLSYIHPKGLPAWETVNVINSFRPYGGKTFHGPLVVVRRTSRQGDKNRAIGTIINSDKKVAIENHLIVLIPKDKNISTCNELIRVLKDTRTNHWMNEIIRCRHLTIKSLANMPWWSE